MEPPSHSKLMENAIEIVTLHPSGSGNGTPKRLTLMERNIHCNIAPFGSGTSNRLTTDGTQYRLHYCTAEHPDIALALSLNLANGPLASRRPFFSKLPIASYRSTHMPGHRSRFEKSGPRSTPARRPLYNHPLHRLPSPPSCANRPRPPSTAHAPPALYPTTPPTPTLSHPPSHPLLRVWERSCLLVSGFRPAESRRLLAMLPKNV